MGLRWCCCRCSERSTRGLLRSGRGLPFWIRACGFELGTVFGVAGLTRLLCDQAGLRALLGGG
jgi:hypothetical protein